MDDWRDGLSGRTGDTYTSLADALEKAIRSGYLTAGSRLPTHRALAKDMGLAVSTVSRAYAEAARRGLVGGTAGRGTFVREVELTSAGLKRDGLRPIERLYLPFMQREDAINLSLNEPMPEGTGERLRPALLKLANSLDLSHLARYQPAHGLPVHRAAGVKWLQQAGVNVSADDVFVVSGGQTAVMTIFLALARPGDTVLTEELTWPGAISAGRLGGIHLVPVAMDDEGITPESFERACVERKPRFVYTMPTLHNPTTATAGAERRRQIVRIAREHDVMIVEDDAYGFLLNPRSLTYRELAPDITVYLSTLSKAISPALRIGYLAVPQQLQRTFRAASRATIAMVSPILLDVATQLIEDGAAEDAIKFQTAVAARRQAMASRLLNLKPAAEASFHLWLRTPPDMPSSSFVAEALAKGVSVTPGDAFAVDTSKDPGGVRLCLCAEPDENRLIAALQVIEKILHSDRMHAPSLV
jgi:DNA-binding transcriptional MocR family regulator